MATLPLAIGDTIIQESIIGSQFTGKILDKVKFYDYDAIIPSIRGAAWITGKHTFLLQKQDIYPKGFVV